MRPRCSLIRRLPGAVGLLSILLSSNTVRAQTTYTFDPSINRSAWIRVQNWLVGGTTSTKFPGVTANTSVNTVAAQGANSDIAEIGRVGFSASNGIFGLGINFSNSSTNPNGGNGGANGLLSLGAIVFDPAASGTGTAQTIVIGNSSTTAGANGVLQLNGATVANFTNTLVAVTGTSDLTFAPSIAPSTGNQPAMSISLGAAAGTFLVNSGRTLTVGTVIADAVAGASLTIQPGDGVGGGRVVLTGANTYSGGTNVNGSTLVVSNATGSSATGTGAVTVASGATLAGTGFLAPNTGNTITISGTVAPGATAGTVGTLTFGTGTTSAAVTTTTGAAYAFDLATAGTANPPGHGGSDTAGGHDALVVNGTLNVAGMTVNPTALAGSGFDPNSNYSWTIATATGGITGFSQAAVGTPTGFSSYSGTFSLLQSMDTNSLFLEYTVAPVPEPGSVLAVAAAGLGLGYVRRRRSRAETETV